MPARADDAAAPAVVLMAPQLGENIGQAARAMHNFGLRDLRLVAPRDGWPSDKARAAASGADPVIDAARVYGELAAALADLELVFATTARRRDMLKDVLTPAAAAAELRGATARGVRAGILFGGERAGLDSDAVAAATKILTIPTSAAFSSLNLAHAVLLVAYEWHRSADASAPAALPMGATRPATMAEFDGFFARLEAALDQVGFLWPPEKRPGMIRNLRATLMRATLTEQEVRTWHGIVSALAPARRPDPPESV